MKKPNRLKIAFSGGETSGYMLQWCQKNMFHLYDDVRVLFANTGQENEETLIFVDKVSKYFDVPVVWIESVVHNGSRKGSTHKVVDFNTASRDGEPFEAVIKKYGIPNEIFKPCTRELKTNPMDSYMRSIGWATGTYDTAIGIRADEANRVSENAQDKRIIYPLVHSHPVSKPDVNAFWRDMPFRLDLTGYQGNCKWCHKKSLRKLIAIMQENPDAFEFPERMEMLYGFNGARIEGDTEPRRFFRGHRTVADIRELARTVDVTRLVDDARVYPHPGLFDVLDEDDGCVESCEAY